MFTLQRVYAFSVSPQGNAAEPEAPPPDGGLVRLTAPIREVLDKAFAKAGRSAFSTVDFDFNDDREHIVRNDVMAAAFGATQGPRAAASRLASRLATTMDNRSHAALFVVAVEADALKRRVSLLVLPREDVVQFEGTNEEVLLNLLRNVFSTGSSLRKLARLEGHQSKTQFLSADVLDFQLASTFKTTADFWIKDFLGAKPRVDSKTGSRQLAGALQRAFEAADDNVRDAVFAAMFKASAGTVRKTSLNKFAEDLPNEVHDAFFNGIPSDEMRRTFFDLDRSVMKDSLARRIITGKDGVVLSAPAETIGKSVELGQRGKTRTVTYAGSVEKERVVRGTSRRGKGSKS
jgi:hypothetical protein